MAFLTGNPLIAGVGCNSLTRLIIDLLVLNLKDDFRCATLPALTVFKSVSQETSFVSFSNFFSINCLTYLCSSISL